MVKMLIWSGFYPFRPVKTVDRLEFCCILLFILFSLEETGWPAETRAGIQLSGYRKMKTLKSAQELLLSPVKSMHGNHMREADAGYEYKKHRNRMSVECLEPAGIQSCQGGKKHQEGTQGEGQGFREERKTVGIEAFLQMPPGVQTMLPEKIKPKGSDEG